MPKQGELCSMKCCKFLGIVNGTSWWISIVHKECFLSHNDRYGENGVSVPLS